MQDSCPASGKKFQFYYFLLEIKFCCTEFMSRAKKSWLQRQQKDQFVKQARASQYRSRAAYKLQEIDKRDQLFKNKRTIVDVGASPGSWSQYASERVGSQGRIIAVDILPVQAINNVSVIQGDFCDEQVVEQCIQALSGTKADLVMSDIAPNLSGVRMRDQARSVEMAELVLEFAKSALKDGGDLLVKMFQGEGAEADKLELKHNFQKLMIRKPKASRPESREF